MINVQLKLNIFKYINNLDGTDKLKFHIAQNGPRLTSVSIKINCGAATMKRTV